ncbi:hydroxyacid dehydrogenase [Alicyclobacillus mengziensis]|uniref:Hydroxyacid dehydrogenase n=1 Tax=Alicyclobacillus mengziensis TaxID=2931921 RepID=A0A9X7Z5U0_9BACL|nr:hydroxyacid dehydrogenase [Alicyclobacillus mengziensis]QSO45605.1 hydroxyacid dehydrogenase [Alicyclobacillus mengziensis]
MSIVISEHLWWPLPDWFDESYPVMYDTTLVENRDVLLRKVQEAKAIIVRNKTRVDRELLEIAPQLKVVGRLGVGLDNIDVPACRDHDVKVVAARGCNATSVAEYVMACLLHHTRFLDRCSQIVKSGVWDRSLGTGTELYGKTLGLVGIGDIGQRVASRARAFGMRILAFDPFVLASSAVVQDVGVELVSLEEVLTSSHFISVHVPLTRDTKSLIGMEQLHMMREASVLINTSRGGIIDENALSKVLVQRPTMAAYLDVREQEPPQQDEPLSQVPNATLTPHIAGITVESSARVAEFVLRQVANALSGSPIQGLV